MPSVLAPHPSAQGVGMANGRCHGFCSALHAAKRVESLASATPDEVLSRWPAVHCPEKRVILQVEAGSRSPVQWLEASHAGELLY